MNEQFFDCCCDFFDRSRTVQIKWEKLEPYQSGGKPIYAAPQICRGIITRSRETDSSSDLILLLPGEATVSPGDRITLQRKHYHLSEVQICRTLDGRIAARRCLVK